MRKCRKCGLEFSSSYSRQVFCSKACREEEYNGLPYASKHLSPATIGAVSEMRVVVDLLVKGFEVFRAVSPSCSCDLIALKDGKAVRVECRTGFVSPSKKIYTSRTNVRADVLAIVLASEIVYEPGL